MPASFGSLFIPILHIFYSHNYEIVIVADSAYLLASYADLSILLFWYLLLYKANYEPNRLGYGYVLQLCFLTSFHV